MRKIPKYKPDNEKTAADFHGQWTDKTFSSNLVDPRMKKYWYTPICRLPNGVLSLFLRQNIAVRIAKSVARERVAARYVDGSEWTSDELNQALNKRTRKS